MEVALSPHIMLFVLQLAMSIMIFVTVWLMKIVIIVFLNISDDCQSICNSNTKKATGNFQCRGCRYWSEDGDANVDSDDIMMMMTKWWYG